MDLIVSVLAWGTLTGVIHFVAIGILYANPWVDRLYARAAERDAAVRKWPSRPRYLVTQFLGTQVEVYIIAAGYLWLRPLIPMPWLGAAMLLGLLFAAVRVYPRFWNMWIQSTYPRPLLAVELVNGTIGTFVMTLSMQLLSRA